MRDRLYEVYVSTHLNHLRETNFAKDARLFHAIYLSHLPTNRHKNILEVGCGIGSFLWFLQREEYTNAYGIDFGPEQIARARSMQLPVEQAEALGFLAAHPGAYDCICGFDVLEHFPSEDVVKFLDLAYDALKLEGRLILRVPNGETLLGTRYRYMDFTHKLAFTAASISQVLRVAGFRTINCYPLEPHVHGISSAVRWTLWQGIKLLLRFYLLVEQGHPGSGILTANLLAVADK